MTERKIVLSDQANPYFCDWLTKRLNNEFSFPPEQVRTVGYVETDDGKSFREDQILAVTAFHNWQPHSCEVSLASSGEKKQKASREYIWHCFHFVFDVAGKARLDANIPVDNYKSQVVADMLGMKKLCLKKDHYGEGKDAFLFGLTKKEWQEGPWAHQYNPNSINKEKNEGVQ
jgi:RimJ/RimL family protein N-acetyltransferase